jgi:hypothetical protein
MSSCISESNHHAKSDGGRRLAPSEADIASPHLTIARWSEAMILSNALFPTLHNTKNGPKSIVHLCLPGESHVNNGLDEPLPWAVRSGGDRTRTQKMRKVVICGCGKQGVSRQWSDCREELLVSGLIPHYSSSKAKRKRQSERIQSNSILGPYPVLNLIFGP